MSEQKVGFIDNSRIPFVREGFYATNNQFQKAGPKGFIEVKILENDDLYVRVDLPGVPDDAVRHRVDAVRQKVVFFSGETFNEKDVGRREYSGTAGLGCDCCEITGVDAKMKDGVLRMIVSRVKVNKDQQDNKCTLIVPPFTGKSGIRLEDHPYLVKGRKGAIYGAPSPNVEGAIYFVVDMPGVSGDDDVEVCANENEIRFKAEIKKVYEHDESARIYKGSIKSPPCAQPLNSSNTIAWDAQSGVLLIIVKPPGSTTNKNN